MKEITVTSQSQFDALPKAFEEFTRIYVKCDLSVSFDRTNSTVVARGSSHVEAWDSSHVEARGSSRVVAQDSSHVEAWGSSHVVARGSSHVVARGSSHVVARDSSHVEAWDSSHVEARDSVAVHVQSEYTAVSLFAFAVALAVSKKCKIAKKSKTCTVVIPEQPKGTDGWIESQGIVPKRGKAILFKRVSKDYQTQEGTPNATTWKIGSTLEHTAWKPKEQECGAGKFHACSTAYFCDEFRSDERDDRYIAIECAVADLYVWPEAQYPHKIAFRKGKVLYECDRYGKKI